MHTDQNSQSGLLKSRSKSPCTLKKYLALSFFFSSFNSCSTTQIALDRSGPDWPICTAQDSQMPCHWCRLDKPTSVNFCHRCHQQEDWRTPDQMQARKNRCSQHRMCEWFERLPTPDRSKRFFFQMMSVPKKMPWKPACRCCWNWLFLVCRQPLRRW